MTIIAEFRYVVNWYNVRFMGIMTPRNKVTWRL